MLTVLPEPMRNTRLLKLLSTANMSAGAPETMKFLSTDSSPLVSVIVCPLSEESKLIVPPSTAAASAWRSEPAVRYWYYDGNRRCLSAQCDKQNALKQVANRIRQIFELKMC